MPKQRPQRRLAAILAADVVGYSRMMARDEAGTLARLKDVRRGIVVPIVGVHGGRIIKLAGDGTLIAFGSVVEAVAAAVSIQRRVLANEAQVEPEARIVLRIGLNVGDLIVEDGDIYGDGVNVAARLEAVAEPGGIAISAAVHDQIRDKLPFAFRDAGEHGLKNIDRPIRVFVLGPEEIASLPESAIGTPGHAAQPARAVLRRAAFAALFLGSVLVGSWGLHAIFDNDARTEKQSIAGPPLSIVVLPFVDLSPETSADYLADGLTEDLTTDLSRIPGSFVIARNTAFTYKGKSVDVKQVGRELGVRYVLEGSVRRTGDSIRVNAQLINSDSGAHLWAERFDDTIQNVLALQDRVASRIARALDLQLVEAESRGSTLGSGTSPDVTDLAMRGWALINRPRSSETTLQAADFFQQALAIDPDNARAGLGLARASYFMTTQRLVANPALLLDRAETLARRAVALDPASGLAHNVLGDVLTGKKQLDAALTEMRKAVEINRNDAGAWGSIGYLTAMTGQFEEAVEPLQHAIQISPRDPSLWVWRMWTGLYHFELGRNEEALRWLRSAVQANPNAYLLFFYYGGVAGQIGPPEEARAAVETMRRLRPEVSLARLRAETPSDHPRYMAMRSRIIDGLAKGGLPET